MPIEIKTFENLLQSKTNIVVARTDLTDLLDASQVLQFLAASSRSDETIYFQLAKLLTAFNINTATGDDLEKRAKDYDVDLRGATRAQGQVRFERPGTVGTETIPVGTIVAGPVEYKTLLAATILGGATQSDIVPALAVDAGEEGNADIGDVNQVISVVAIDGLTVTNVTPMQDGGNEETGPQIRDRIRSKIRGLNRTSPDALWGQALSTELDSGEAVKTASVIEPLTDPSRIDVYIDNGSGTTEVQGVVGVSGILGTGELIIVTATGGEKRFYLINPPVVRDSVTDVPVVQLWRNGSPLTLGTDYHIQTGTGEIQLDPTAFPTGLSAGDSIEAHYNYWSGLIQEVQWKLDGRSANAERWPGGRAAGARAYVLPPTVIKPAIQMTVIVDQEYDSTTVKTRVQNEIIAHINDGGIGDDVIIAELIDVAMEIPGVLNVPISGLSPTADIAIADDQLARVTEAEVTIL
jgi:uncharacterized phage protein gp47/JayE